MGFMKKAAPYLGVLVLGVAGGLYLGTTAIGASILGTVGLNKAAGT